MRRRVRNNTIPNPAGANRAGFFRHSPGKSAQNKGLEHGKFGHNIRKMRFTGAQLVIHIYWNAGITTVAGILAALSFPSMTH